jgi:putative peptidoglycan lipid II flippase
MAQHGKLAKTAGMISILTMISRITGFIRDSIGGANLGAGLANDAYLAAFRIPNLLRDLFAEGALSSAFVPTFTETTVKGGQEHAWRLVSVVVNFIIVVMLGLILAGEIWAPGLVRMIVPGFGDTPEKLSLTIQLTRILLPFLAFVSLAAVFMGVLNSSDKFSIPAFAPVMFNLTMIASGVMTMHMAGVKDSPEKIAVWWAWGAMIGGILQMAIQVPMVLKLGFRWEWNFDWKNPGLRRILTLMGPAILGLSVMQINLFVNTIIASYLPEGSVTYLYYGNRLMQLPLGVFGVAIATALLPMSAKHLARGEKDEFVKTLSFGLRLLFVITVPAAVGIIVLSEPINRLLFEYGRFTPDAVKAVAYASLLYTTGLVAYAGVKVVVPTFYALNDPKTPLISAVLAVVVNIGLNLILMRPLGYKGLALATSVAAFVNFGFLMVMLRKKVGALDGRRIMNSLLRVCLASAGMGWLVWSGSQGWLPAAGAHVPRGVMAFKVFALIGFGAFAYAAFGWFFQIPEQKRVWTLVKSKVGLRGTNESWME